MKFEMEARGTDTERGPMEDDYRGCCVSSPRFVFGPSFPFRYILYLMAGSILALIGIATLIWKPVDVLLHERLKMVPGLPPYDWWKTPPDVVVLKAYVFNITNSEEFIRGETNKLKVQEVGPYIFKEKFNHTNVVFHKNGTMTYVATRMAVFQPEMNTLKLNDTIIVANIATLGIPSYLWDASFLTRQGVRFLMNRLNSKPFVKITVDDYFWNFTDPLLQLSNHLLPFLVPTDNVGILHQVYRDFVDDVTVHIGPETRLKRNFFEINRWRGGPGLGVWPNKTCDSVEGSSEGVHYHQDFRRNDTLRYLRKTICRAVSLYYTKDIKRYGMTGYRYELPNDTFSRPENPEEECYKTKKYPLMPSGISDVSPCYFNLPIVSSFPHFMFADPQITERLEGLTPDYEKHGSVATVEPTTGIPLIAWARSQCSMYIPDMKGFPKLKNFSNMAIPMFWLEYKLEELPSYITYAVYIMVVLLPASQFYISLGLIALSFLIFSYISSKIFNKSLPYVNRFFKNVAFKKT
ncbi:scavenger receptor class B member 1 isoform X1 [Halyomorpha halys]|uniref:scavenger receptor class B member 1 isoform X1 n=1 Tax=Halyomorpha halys TaxID=286706 RepID=UPI0006D4D2FA|nr:scavenger receptor class B member 1-like [Halyomorpha halys]